MQQSFFTVMSNLPLTPLIYKMTLKGNTSQIKNCGQFINIRINGLFLRRPISVCDYDAESITIIYKIVGKGTRYMSELCNGDKLDVLTGLGNGYDTSLSGQNPLLIGGGVGVPPLYKLAKNLVAQGKHVMAVLGFNSREEAFYIDEFADLGVDVHVATVDGSLGTKGYVTDAMKDLSYSYFYVCGNEPMMKAVFRATSTSGQFSFEERMGCGFGACMGCSCKTIAGNKRICKDGPVLTKEEILWEE